jgi:hypothetical protein
MSKVAVLGDLPMAQGTVRYAVPTSLRAAGASGLLVFAWCSLEGVNPAMGYWHMTSQVAPDVQNWFSLIGVGSQQAGNTAFNSQAFWLPMPVDGMIAVSLVTPVGDGFTSPRNRGQVEIHGYQVAHD